MLLIKILLAITSAQVVIISLLAYRQHKLARALPTIETRYQLLQQQSTHSAQRIEDHLTDLERLLHSQTTYLRQSFLEKLNESNLEQTQKSMALKEQLQQSFNEHRSQFDARQLETHKIMHDTLQKGMLETRKEVKESLSDYATQFGKRVGELTQTTDARLKEINQQVEKRLSEGLEKTNETFTDIIKRLAMIDAAQQKISELSTHVVSLEEILNDKRSRGTFGEVQLSALIRNVLPEQHFSFQHSLSNHLRPDCILFLPEPTGNIAIDAKFPLENFRVMIDSASSEMAREQAIRQFRVDIKKHISDIAEKYIITGETADGAMMFIPAEAVFAEIHARYPDLVEAAHRAKVWLVSPTTMMAILTTARAVLKDAATRKQLHTIQNHLRLLANDFTRFQGRMDKLAQHIDKAHTEVSEVHTSAQKITKRFGLIEKVELEALAEVPVPIEAEADA